VFLQARAMAGGGGVGVVCHIKGLGVARRTNAHGGMGGVYCLHNTLKKIKECKKVLRMTPTQRPLI